eukprot:gnl/Dysnectes_brevis/1249_a1396_4580.p1 GENE.gnl/Dysnectes_brevis/1249_a1396_4580~~gnl/Dysnectes_brevis/1249_a1396_4580.p1  ORF type:complete len:139 (-),score=29.62 gnl/Dysnectes_brevis/1249_a1396_4580:34-450(-)
MSFVASNLLPKTTSSPFQEVSLEDQQRINTFSRLHMIYDDTKPRAKAAVDKFEDMESASIELAELLGEDGDEPMIRVGSGFFPAESMDIDTHLDERKEEAEAEKNGISSHVENLELNLDRIRSILKRKFGDNIGLDYK